MAQMILCKRNIHYYDAEKTADCPYCKRIEEGRGGDPTAAASASDLASPPRREPTVAKGRSVHVEREATSPWYGEEQDGKKEAFEPVVGWLVAIEGPARGRDFRLKPGRNIIGRSMESDVCIESDDLLSGEHAIIYYYGEINGFFVEDKQSKHGTYLLPNKELVIERRPLKDGDKVKVGKTILLIKTLCNEAFKWEE